MTQENTHTRSRNDATRMALLEAILKHVAFDGWSESSFNTACKEVRISKGDALLSCPRKELDLIEAWSRKLDAEAVKKISVAKITTMKIRERVTFGVLCRLETIAPHEEAARRARARLLLPDAVQDGPKLLWATSDMIWRAIGDQSTDANFYSKRTILSGVYATTLSGWLNEDDSEKPEARAFLDRRIQNVMDFEKTKAQMNKLTADLPDMASILGKLRFGPGL